MGLCLTGGLHIDRLGHPFPQIQGTGLLHGGAPGGEGPGVMETMPCQQRTQGGFVVEPKVMTRAGERITQPRRQGAGTIYVGKYRDSRASSTGAW